MASAVIFIPCQVAVPRTCMGTALIPPADAPLPVGAGLAVVSMPAMPLMAPEPLSELLAAALAGAAVPGAAPAEAAGLALPHAARRMARPAAAIGTTAIRAMCRSRWRARSGAGMVFSLSFCQVLRCLLSRLRRAGGRRRAGPG